MTRLPCALEHDDDDAGFASSAPECAWVSRDCWLAQHLTTVLFAAFEQKPLISNNPDFSSILQVDGKLFGVTHFEAPIPATAYLSQYEQDAKTGAIKVSPGLAPCCRNELTCTTLGGVSVPCAGSS